MKRDIQQRRNPRHPRAQKREQWNHNVAATALCKFRIAAATDGEEAEEADQHNHLEQHILLEMFRGSALC